MAAAPSFWADLDLAVPSATCEACSRSLLQARSLAATSTNHDAINQHVHVQKMGSLDDVFNRHVYVHKRITR